MTASQQAERAPTASPIWPALPLEAWQDTRDTLHLWTQIVGKIRMGAEPPRPHWWHVPLYVSGRGLTTSLVSDPRTPFEAILDFRGHRLLIEVVDGRTARVDLYPRSVADFYGEVMAVFEQLHIDVAVNPRPVEVEESIPFYEDTVHASYDGQQARDFWLALVSTQRVLRAFSGGFCGKSSPVHFFWGSFDLAQTRFSGRPAPLHPGGVPNCPDHVMQSAYSHEVSSCGFWPGGAAEGVFYAYSYPEPDGYRRHPVEPTAAGYVETLQEFALPYADLRVEPDPDRALLDFFQSTYEAAASSAHWDRSLEVVP